MAPSTTSWMDFRGCWPSPTRKLLSGGDRVFQRQNHLVAGLGGTDLEVEQVEQVEYTNRRKRQRHGN